MLIANVKRSAVWKAKVQVVAFMATLMLVMLCLVETSVAAAQSSTTVRALAIDSAGSIKSEATVNLSLVPGEDVDLKAIGEAAWSPNQFSFAAWVAASLPAPLGPNFLQGDTGAERLQIKSLQLAADSDDSHKDMVKLTADPTVASGDQEKVELWAPVAEVANHLILVYTDAASVLRIPVEFNNNVEIKAVGGNQYNQAVRELTFTKISGQNLYSAGLTVTTWRNRHIVFKNQNDSILSEQDMAEPNQNYEANKAYFVDDNSSSGQTVRTYNLVITNDVKKIKVIGELIKQNNVALRINHVKTTEVSGAYTKPVAYNIPRYVQNGAQVSCSNVPSNRYSSGIDNTDGWAKKYGCGQLYGSGTNTATIGYGDRVFNTTTTSYTDDIRGGSSDLTFYVDAIPSFCSLWGDNTDSNCSVNPVQQDWLSRVTLNGQQFYIPSPTLCKDPNGQISDACYIDSIDGWSWSRWERKARYFCQRAWLFDLNIAAGSNFGSCESKASGKTIPPKVLFTQTVSTGINAGTKITVSLDNARLVAEAAYSLENYDAGAANNDGWHGPDNRVDANRWRTRYKIELINVRNMDNTVTVDYDWSVHNETKLNTSPAATSVGASVVSSVSVYGPADVNSDRPDYREVKWRQICTGKGGDCTFNYQEGDQSDRPKLPLAVKIRNGYINPEIRYSDGNVGDTGELNTCSATGESGCLVQTNPQFNNPSVIPAPATTGGYLYAEIPKSKAGTYNLRKAGAGYGWYRAARFVVPIQVTAELREVPLKYYATANADEDLSRTGFPEATVDVVRNYAYTVTSHVPLLPQPDDDSVSVFSYWQAVGYKDGQRVGVIYDHVKPNQLLDFSDPRFADSSDPRFADGSPVFSNSQGEAVIDEIRMIPVAAKLQDQKSYFMLKKQLSGVAQPLETMLYRAVSGLTAQINPAYFADADNRQVMKEDKTYTLSASRSTRSVDTTTNSDLVMMYVLPGIPIKFTKSVSGTPGWDSTPDKVPSAEQFRLRLTPLSPAGTPVNNESPVDVSHSAAESPISGDETVQPGTYQLSEQVQQNNGWAVSYLWTPSANGFSCTAADSDTNLVNNGVLTVAENLTTSQITCQVTNQAAAVALVTYDPTGSDVGQGYSFSFTPSAENLPKYEDWRAKSVVTQSGDFFPGGQQYQLLGTAPAGMKILGYQRFSGEPSEKSAAQIHFGTADKWGPITGADNRSIKTSFSAVSEVSDNVALNDNNQRATGVNITTVNNQFDVYRAVVVPENQLATLKFTKAYAADTQATNPLQLGPTQSDYPVANWALELQRTGGFKTLIGHNHTNLDANNPGGLAYLQKGSGYTVQEKYQAAAGQEYGINNAFGATSFTCDNGSTVTNGQLTLQQGGTACTVTNAPARFSVVLYSPESQQFLDNDQVKLNFVSSDETARVLDQNWPGKENPRQSATWLTPEAAYSVAVSLPAGWYYTGLERYPADSLPDQFAADDTWEPVTNITVPAGKHYVYRVNASPIRAELPAAGSLLTPFVFLGLGLALIAGGFAARRRLARTA